MAVRKTGVIVSTALSVVGFVAGLNMERFLDRAMPVISVDRVLIEKDPSFQLDVPRDVQEFSEQNPWLPALNPSETVRRLQVINQSIDKLVSSRDAALEKVSRALGNLPSVARQGAKDKRAFLRDLVDDTIDASLTGGLARREIPLGETPEYPPDQLIAELMPLEDEPGFKLHLGPSAYHFYYRDPSFDPLLEPAAKALAYFDTERIKKMLEYVHADLVTDPSELRDFRTRIAELVAQSERVTVTALITNKGRSPLTLSRWGAIRLLPSGTFTGGNIELRLAGTEDEKANEDMSSLILKLAHEGEEESLPVAPAVATIPPGSSVSLRYYSSESVPDLAEKIKDLSDVLRSGTVEAVFCAVRVSPPWYSTRFPLSARCPTAGTKMNEELKAELLERLATVCK